MEPMRLLLNEQNMIKHDSGYKTTENPENKPEQGDS